MKLSKYDWKKIKQDYVTGNSTYAELIKKYNITSKTAFNKMALKEEFVKSREKYRKKIETKTLEKLAKSESDKLVEMCTASKNMSSIIAEITENKGYFFKDDDIDVIKIEGVLNAIDKSTATIRNLYGIRTQKEQDSYELALKKLQVEQSKINNDGNDKSENGVIYLPKMLVDKEVE